MELDCKNMAMEQLQEENKGLKVALRTLRDLLPIENYNNSVIQQGNANFIFFCPQVPKICATYDIVIFQKIVLS